MKKSVPLLLILFCFTQKLSAQQDPIYAQYLNNPLTINPAYAGINNQFSARVQATFTFHEFYSAGIFTGNFKTYGTLVQVLIKNYHLGYVFELPGSKDSSLRFTSHEITLGISLGVLTYHDKVAKVF